MTDLQHGLRVDPTNWEAFRQKKSEEHKDMLDYVNALQRPEYQWQTIVARERARKQHQKSLRYRIAQALRRLVTWVEPR